MPPPPAGRSTLTPPAGRSIPAAPAGRSIPAAPAGRSIERPCLQVLPANCFTIQQLTEAYNQSRVDYLVPMPMNAARLAEYIRMYDVDLERSFVAVEAGQLLGLGMLGARPNRSWITRLGVLPNSRRRGQGLTLMQSLLRSALDAGLGFTTLEVIKHNQPALELFLKLGFREVNELLILRRPPGQPAGPPPSTSVWLTRAEVQDRLGRRGGLPPWTNQNESFDHGGEVCGLAVAAAEGEGWAAFLRERFMITHLVLATEQGDPEAVGRALLAHVHRRYPALDTHAENIATTDPHLGALYDSGYVESFRRVQMYRDG